MKTRFVVNSLSCWIIGVSALAGCSVVHEAVPSRPPVLNTRLEKLTHEYGEVKFDKTEASVSVFLWRDGLTEAETQAEVRTVNAASAKMDSLTEALVGLGGTLMAAQSAFSTKDCESFVARRSRKDPDVVVAWKPAPTDPEALKTFNECQTTQATILDSKSEMAKSEAEASQAYLALRSAIDLKDAGTKNWKEIDKNGCSLVLSPSAVSLTLKDFEYSGNTLATDLAQADPRAIRNASYDPATRLLTFEFNETDSSGTPTGATYKFALERAQDFMGMARYKGDVTLVSASGAVLRNGSAQLQGHF